MGSTEAPVVDFLLFFCLWEEHRVKDKVGEEEGG